MNQANEVPRLTRAQQTSIREEARVLSEELGRTVTPRELLNLIVDDGVQSAWELLKDGRWEAKRERRFAAWARLMERDEEAFSRAMAQQLAADIEHFTGVGHKDPRAAAASQLRANILEVLKHEAA